MRTSRRRQEEIVHLATTTGLASVDELSARFAVSSSTIRRDLARLQSLGRLARTFGGATAIGSASEDAVRHRLQEAFDAKRDIARWAAQQIRPGETIALDTGSTVAALAHQLRLARDVTVATTSLRAMQELSGTGSVHVECLGGTLRRLSEGLVGPLAEMALERMTFDRAFLGADGSRRRTASAKPTCSRRGSRSYWRATPDTRTCSRMQRSSGGALSTPGRECPEAGRWSPTRQPTRRSSPRSSRMV
jgi:DeoR/GlpR family transcriptional regulator of sugar metabolism